MHTLIPLLLLKSHAILPTVYYYLRAVIFSRSYPLISSYLSSFILHPPSSTSLLPVPPFRFSSRHFEQIFFPGARIFTQVIWREAGCIFSITSSRGRWILLTPPLLLPHTSDHHRLIHHSPSTQSTLKRQQQTIISSTTETA